MSEVKKLGRTKKREGLEWWKVGLILVLAGASAFGAMFGLTKLLNFTPPDEEAPVLTLRGEEEVEIWFGGAYEEPGAEAVDERDGEVEVAIKTPEMDVWNEGEYEVWYRAVDAAGNEAKASRRVRVVAPPAVPGAVYLTFDDGPSEHTARLLDILKKYKVQATFFVTGRGEDAMIKREYEEGHAVGLHTFSHNYAYIYQNRNAFWDDMLAIQNRVKEATGGYVSNLMRFPGGSSNTVSALYDDGTQIMSRLVGEAEARGFKYFDWNISSGDASGNLTVEEVVANVTGRLGEGEWVVLQHDTMGFSVDAVEQILQFGKKNGYQFKRLEADSFGAWHWVRN